mmetsp:Transcript_9248/g.23366  ORF Transcript_9248/g.23366 Transcript_9248/m.23366 type:complete len:501 (-) Transcript_9248:250-1752(-)
MSGRSTERLAGSRVPQPAPRLSAATSHAANDKYMDDWDEAYEHLQAMGRAAGASALSSSKPKPRKWEPPAGGWQDTMPEPAPGPRPARPGPPSELDQLHQLAARGSSGPARQPAARTSRSALGRGTPSRAPGGSAPAVPRYPPEVVGAFWQGPADPQGMVVDVSDRPNICASVDWAAGEAVIGCSDHALYGVDVHSGRLRRTLYTKKSGHAEWVTCVTHTADGRVVSGGMDSRLCLWPRGGSTCQNLEGHSSSVSQVKLDRRSGAVLSASYDKTVKVWDVNSTRARLGSSLEGHAAPVLELETGPGGLAISGDRSGHILLWDLHTGGSSWRLKNVHRGHITALAWYGGGGEEDTHLFMSGGQDGCLRVWDRRERSNMATKELHVNDQGVGALSDILPPMRATAEKVVTAGADGVVRILEPRQSFAELHAVPVTNFIYSCAAAGGLALVGCGDGALHVIDIENGAISYALGANQAAVRTIDASADRMVAAGDDGNVIIYSF